VHLVPFGRRKPPDPSHATVAPSGRTCPLAPSEVMHLGGAGVIDGGGATVVTWGSPKLAGGEGYACRCAPDETRAKSAEDINDGRVGHTTRYLLRDGFPV
jgi:hypothetical protein